MRIFKAAALGALVLVVLLVAVSTAFAEVQLTIRDGRVTLVARDATVRQILTEWAQIGQTKVVNVERLPGGPVTLQLTNVPEEEALDILLRSVSGYMAAPRPTAVANLSRYDRILVMPTLAAARPVAATPTPIFRQPAVSPTPADDNTDDDRPTPSVVMPTNGPLFQTFQQPQVVNPRQGTPGAIPGTVQQQPASVAPAPVGQQPAIAAPYPGSTVVGAPRPGMVIQPQPPVQPGQAPQPTP